MYPNLWPSRYRTIRAARRVAVPLSTVMTAARTYEVRTYGCQMNEKIATP
jgi:hypothetical protein